ncbi:MAG TPA: DUF72 domain-containing protein [Acidisoma sp.]|uniref:DUF72 domain-containing protein n=1 Tax=Acidisoma sp. TaxID=1872115 RepID=UPI002D01FC16|nr:DUF72 domain-containing protein [Acidisoma sp.]HTI03460.1 DUF72 domain-containing protein [Acidisoma sp.]
MAQAGGRIRIGISGWTYAPWRGVFYPKGLRRKDELSYAARQVTSIEINGTFYGQQKPQNFAAWGAAVPEDFVFSVKAPRFLTHIRRLREVETPLANFLAGGLLSLGPKLGPILWQLPPSFRFDAEGMARFLDLLPQDTEEAARLARRHDDRLKGRAVLETDACRPLRHAIEIRHESFRDIRFVDMLRARGVALVCADTVSWPRLMDATADFMYCRLHGSEELYASGYNDAALDDWARRCRAWASGREPGDAERVGPRGARVPRDVYVYFDNDLKVRAPADARSLMGRLKLLAADGTPRR